MENEIEYGLVCTLKNKNELYFEPITDEIDGFVIRNSEGFIIGIFLEDNKHKVNK